MCDSAGWRSGVAWVVLLFLLAAGLRVGFVLARWGAEGRAAHLDYPDEEAYVLAAESLAAGEGLVDEFGYRATYMPGYPAFLAVFQGLDRPLLWARIGQALLAAWVAPATFLLARRFVRGVGEREGIPAGVGARRDSRTSDPDTNGRGSREGIPAGVGARKDSRTSGRRDSRTSGRRDSCTSGPYAGGVVVPVLAGVGAACDPFLIFFSGLLLTEALFAAVMVTAWVFLINAGRSSLVDKIAGPVFLWMAVMLRPSAAALVILAPVALMVLKRFRRDALIQAVMIPAIVMAALTPWAVRNRAVIGEWRWLSTRGGISLYDGLQPGATGGSDLAHTKKMREIQGFDELEWDVYFRNAALEEVRRDPGRALRLAGRKFLRTWSLTPNVENYRAGAAAVISAVWMGFVLATAAAGWWRVRRQVTAWSLLLLPVAAFTLLHMVYVGSVRYRVPVMPFVVVLSAVGVWGVVRWVGGRWEVRGEK